MGAQQHWTTTASTNATADGQVNLAENQAPSTLNDAVRAVMAQMKKTIGDFAGGLVTTGSATAFAVTSNEVITSLSDGLMVRARAHTASGASPTFALDGTAAKAIKIAAGVVAPIGTLIAGGIYTFTYYLSDDCWIVSGGPPINFLVGQTIEWNSNTLPPGFLWEDGSAVSRTTYAALYAAIGTQFGSGNGTTTFNVPDSRGRTDVGRDNQGSGAASRLSGYGSITGTTLGSAGGSESHQLTASESGQKAISGAPVNISDPGHTHSPSGANIAGNGSSFDAALAGSAGRITSIAGFSLTSAFTGISATFTLAGSSASSVHNNMQPSIIKNKIIYAGV